VLLLTLRLLLGADASTDELKLVAPGLVTSGIDASLAGPLTDHLAKAFSPIRVITSRDISVLVGIERQKELMGCSDGSDACMAELGNALGAQGALLGDIVKVGKVVQINLRVIAPTSGRVLASDSVRLQSEDELLDALTASGTRMRAQLLERAGRVPVSVSASGGRGARRFAPIPLAIAAAGLALGTLFLALAENDWRRISAGMPGSLEIGDAQAIGSEGKGFQVTGAVLLCVGAAAAVAGLGLMIFGAPDAAHAQLSVTPGGVAVVGSF
jgi:hypothetical protein